MIEYSIVVPCYNEAENIQSLINGFDSFLAADQGELIIVDNGSTDGTASLKEELMGMYPFIKWVSIEKNIGYGNGIYIGLKQAQGKILGYTHADLQTDPADVKKAVDLIRSFSPEEKTLVKGNRKGRSFIEKLFSFGMEFMVEILLEQSLKEINAQPNVFTKDLFQNLKEPPLDWAFDLYLYYTAKKTGFEIRKMDVIFPAREHGVSKWNTGFLARLAMSSRIIRYCIKLKNQ
jgi:polyisoprenyl-phosphate glycosyltransferase